MQRFELIVTATANDEEELLRLAIKAINNYRHHQSSKVEHKDKDWRWKLIDKEKQEHLPRDLR